MRLSVWPWLWVFILTAAFRGGPAAAEEQPPVKRVAAVVTEYRRNSHADVILTRLLETDTLDGLGRKPRLELVSLYVDQSPANDLSAEFSDKYGFRRCDTIADALTLGTGKLAVEGVLVIAEHGKYPKSDTGQTIYPKRRFFEEIFAVFESSQRSVPVFSDKHLTDNTTDALWAYETAQRLKSPWMAGSSIVSTWRNPAVDLPRGAKVRDMLVLSYGSLDAYGFHGLELLQGLMERRAGGETGVARVRCLTGDAVWNAAPDEAYRPELLDAARSRLTITPRRGDLPLRELVREPVAFVIDYRDGTRGTVLTLNGAVAQWAAAWQTETGTAPESLIVDHQEERPFMHFAHLLQGIEGLMHTRQASWPVERTLFSSVILDAALTSKRDGADWVPTPALHRSYESQWNWQQPSAVGR